MNNLQHRAGRNIRQPNGFSAFIPAPLPPQPPLQFDDELFQLQHDATLELGRLDAAALYLPNPDLFLSMYVKKEALLSSQIEGTQSSLDDVLEFEAHPSKAGKSQDASDVVNYVAAMNYGLERIQELPLSLRLIKEIHQTLLKSGRGQERNPGEFRRSQNWIGASGCNLNAAVFVPPPVHEMDTALSDWERYLHEAKETILIRCALAHAQFETIHPFLDGNGRVGRLLITFMLCSAGAISRPLLYLSYFFKANRQEYYDRLMDVRFKGDWENWVKFFLRGVQLVAKQSRETAVRIVSLQQQHRELINQNLPQSRYALALLNRLFTAPYASTQLVMLATGSSQPTANQLLKDFVNLGVLKEVTGKSRDRFYTYTDYLDLLREGTTPLN